MLCSKEDQPEMSEQDRESFLRWQEYRISHLSFSINLFLTFSIASIGFIIQQNPNLEINQVAIDSESLSTLVWWFISAIFGVLATFSRLVDFRYTAKRIRGGRTKYYCLTKLAGHLTWIFFGCEVVAYCIGVWFFMYAVS
jgi:predicted permease